MLIIHPVIELIIKIMGYAPYNPKIYTKQWWMPSRSGIG
jgi:hypothetical protein